jgi:hypothetical protein
MEIYVQSRGFDQDYDYNWVNEKQNIVESPKIIQKFKHLLQTEKESLLLVRDQGKLLLLVTGIVSANRVDYQQRPIRVSVAWICGDSEENILRHLVIKTLNSFIKTDSFTQKIAEAVESGGENGFSIKSFEIFNSNPKIETINLGDLTLDLEKSLQKNEPENIQELVKELEHRKLPKEDIPLIVITGIQDQEEFDNAGVWRGLAKFTAPISKKKESGISLVSLIGIVLTLGILIFFTLTMVNKSNHPIPTPTTSPTVQPMTETSIEIEEKNICSQELKDCIENFNKEILTLENLSNG